MSTVDGGGVTHSKPVNFKSLAYSFRGGGRLGRTFYRENHKFSFHVDASSGYGSSPFFINGQEGIRSEEHTSELQSRGHLVCRLLLEKKRRTDPAHTRLHVI